MNLKLNIVFWTIIGLSFLISEDKLPIGKWNLKKSVCDEDQYLGNRVDLQFNENGKGSIIYDKKNKVDFEWKMDLDTLKFNFTSENRRKGFVLGAEKFICLNEPFENQMSLKYIDSKCKWIFSAEK